MDIKDFKYIIGYKKTVIKDKIQNNNISKMQGKHVDPFIKDDGPCFWFSMKIPKTQSTNGTSSSYYALVTVMAQSDISLFDPNSGEKLCNVNKGTYFSIQSTYLSTSGKINGHLCTVRIFGLDKGSLTPQMLTKYNSAGYIVAVVKLEEIINKCDFLTTLDHCGTGKTLFYNDRVDSDYFDKSQALVETSSSGSTTNSGAISNTEGLDKVAEKVNYANMNTILKNNASSKQLTGFFTSWLTNFKNINSEIRRYKDNVDNLDLSKLRAIFGLPYQFLPSTDLRIDGSISDHTFGTTYAEMIGSRMNLLYMTPCNSSFLSNYTKDEREGLIGDIINYFGTDDKDQLSNLTENYSGKLYSTIPAYSEYFKYVNPMIRSGAIFLNLHQGLANETADDLEYKSYKGIPLASSKGKSFNWAWNDSGAQSTDYSGNSEGGSNNSDFGGIYSGFKSLQDTLYYKSCIPFYVTSATTVSDNFTNESTESLIASTINGFSDKARELQFLMGTTSRVISQQFDSIGKDVANAKSILDNIVNRIGDNGGIFGTLVGSVKTIVSGGRLMFPNIWANSAYSKAYNINIKLTTPYYDAKSWLINIYAPLCHLVGFVFPRGEFINGYSAPFLVKAFLKGQFNIDMGLITEMSIEKGKEGGWTVDGLPTVVDVSFTIQDLYSTISMSPAGTMFSSNVLKNIAEMDFLANLCGVNINMPDFGRMIYLYEILNLANPITDFIPNLESDLINMVGNKVRRMFSMV